MRNLSLLLIMVLGFSLYAFAQSVPAAAPSVAAVASVAPAVVAPAPEAAPAVSLNFIGIVIAIVAGLNVLLSSVQQIFSSLSKSEPGWLKSLSTIVLAVSKYLGSNPNV